MFGNDGGLMRIRTVANKAFGTFLPEANGELDGNQVAPG